jgi:hypothetical protein
MFFNQHRRFAASSHATARLARAERCLRWSARSIAKHRSSARKPAGGESGSESHSGLQTALRRDKLGGGDLP